MGSLLLLFNLATPFVEASEKNSNDYDEEDFYSFSEDEDYTGMTPEEVYPVKAGELDDEDPIKDPSPSKPTISEKIHATLWENASKSQKASEVIIAALCASSFAYVYHKPFKKKIDHYLKRIQGYLNLTDSNAQKEEIAAPVTPKPSISTESTSSASVDA